MERQPMRRFAVAANAGGREAAQPRLRRMRPCSLERVWAVAEAAGAPDAIGRRVPGGRCRPERAAACEARPQPRVAAAPASRPKVEVAFYRKYTEAMLRRYMRLSMEAGRVPSLLGRELFRGNVTSYRVSSFEDVVLFCIDVERCLARLNDAEKELIRRVALQQYTQGEAAALLGQSLRSVFSGYAAALDRVTEMFMGRGMLEALKSCQ